MYKVSNDALRPYLKQGVYVLLLNIKSINDALRPLS